MTYRTLNGLFAIVLSATLGLVWVATGHAAVCTVSCDQREPKICYETKVAVDHAVTLTDEFGTHRFQTDYLRRLCAPILPDPLDGTHSAGYGGTDDLPAPNVTVSFSTDIGIVTGKLTRPIRYIRTDAEKAIAPGVPPTLTGTNIRTCYPLAKAHPNLPFSWVDQFGPHTGTVQESTFVCLPAQSDADPPIPELQATTAILCFAVNVNGPDALVNLDTWFGPDQARLAHTDNYCLPATRLP